MRAQLLTLDHLVQLMDPALYLHLQSADSTNFFFFFRMLLVWYKREFEYPDVLRLWECLWTDWLSSNFHLFVALAILERHRTVIMDHLKHFDEVLKYSESSVPPCPSVIVASHTALVNELSGTIELQSTLVRAEALFRRFQRTVEAVDKKHNFPAPNIRRRQPSATSTATDSPTVESSTTSGAEAGSSSGNASSSRPGTADNDAQAAQKVISPELRQLLSRKVVKLDKTKVL